VAPLTACMPTKAARVSCLMSCILNNVSGVW
jgi:hypothetical protein